MTRFTWCFLLLLSGVRSLGADPKETFDWPQWQGPDRNAVSREKGLLKEWPKEGPALAWKVKGIGEGMGGIAVSKGRIYTTGDSDGSAWLYALNEADGKQVWKAKIGRGGKLGNVFKPAGPRATPTVDNDMVVHPQPARRPDVLYGARGTGFFYWLVSPSVRGVYPTR